MARNQAMVAEGFFVTPAAVLPRIAALVAPASAPAPGLDPCAGEGLAMQFLANAWNVAPYLVEINAERGAACRQVTPNTLVMDFAAVTAENMALVYNNPPYQDRERGVRDEMYFIQRAHQALSTGGVHIVVIPDYRVVKTPQIARFFTARYDNVRAWRFPDPEYSSYHQMVLVGVKRARAMQDKEAAHQLIEAIQAGLPELPEALDDPYTLPALSAPVIFRGSAIDYAAALEEARTKSWPRAPVQANPKRAGTLNVDGKEAVVDAYASDAGTLVMLSMVGYKTHIKAFKAQLDQREVPLRLPSGEAVTEAKDIRYVTHCSPVDRGEHWVLAHPRATVEGTTEAASQPFYCIGGNKPPYETFVRQLRKAVPIPVFDEWARPLWVAGAKNGLINTIYHAKGCHLWGVNTDADRWRETLSEAMATRQLTLDVATPEADIQPALPFRRGHLLLTIQTDAFKSVILHKEGKIAVVRGRTLKSERSETEGSIERTTTERKGEIFVLDADTGEFVVLQSDEAQINFVKEWGDAIVQAIMERFTPLYQFDFRDTLPERATTLLDLLARSCKPLPGQSHSGLPEAQKHLAAAQYAILQKYGFSILVGEPGCGKTKISIAAAGLEEIASDGGFPLIVSCPETLSKKWVRELQETWPMIAAQIVTSPREMDKFFEQAALNPGRKWAMVIPNSRLGQGDGWTPAYIHERVAVSNGEFIPVTCYRPDGSILWERVGNQGILRDAHGKGIKWVNLAETISAEAEIHDMFRCPTCGERITRKEKKDEDPVIVTDAGWFESEPRYCDVCGGALYQEDRLYGKGRRKVEGGLKYLEQVSDSMRPWLPMTRVSHVADGLSNQALHHCPACNTPLYAGQCLPKSVTACPACRQPLWKREGPQPWHGKLSLPAPVRYSLAEYYCKVHQGKARFYIADEVHLLKGKNTNRGDAFGKLARAVPKVLVMTGTLFNGKASSVFYVLYRLWAKVREQFGFNDLTKWIDQHGTLRRVYRLDKDDAGSSAQTGLNRYQIGVSELPGLSAELVALLLQCTTFAQLKDLGVPLPPFEEVQITVELDADHQRAYKQFLEQGEAQLRDNWKLAGAFSQAMLSYALAPWRETRLVNSEGETVAVAPDMEIVCQHCGKPLKGHRHCIGPRPPQPKQSQTEKKQKKTGGRWRSLQPIVEAEIPEPAQAVTPHEGPCHYHGDVLPDECRDGCGIKQLRLFAPEKKLLELIQAHPGEKVLLYVWHTSEWTMIPRLMQLLNDAGVRAMQMPNLEAGKREAWLASFSATGVDVLVVPAGQIAEGLDATAFSVEIFYEIPHGMVKTLQAAYRPRRINQDKRVAAYYIDPKGTLVSHALYMIIQEMALDLTLKGQLPETTMMLEFADESAGFLERLARAALDYAGNIDDDLAAEFARHCHAGSAEDNAYLLASLPALVAIENPMAATQNHEVCPVLVIGYQSTLL